MKHFSFCLLAIFSNCFGVMADESNLVQMLSIQEAHQIALKQHPRLAAASYQTLAAEQVVKEANSSFYPTANLYGSAVGADSKDTRIMAAGGLNNPSIFDRAAEGITASQLITDFGRTGNLASGARLRAYAEKNNQEATREQVLLKVDETFYVLLQARAVLGVAQQTFKTRELLRDQVSVLASNKLKSELDADFARVAYEEGRLIVQRASSDADAAMANLSSALGFRELHKFQLAEPQQVAALVSTNIDLLIQAALRDRPELASLRNEHEAELKFAKAEKDARYPTISAVGAVGNSLVHDDRLPNNYAAGGIQFSMPLFAGGLYTAKQHEAEFRAKVAQELLRSAEDTVVRDVRIAWLDVNNAVERSRITDQLLKHSSNAYELAEARYKSGSSSIVELSQAQLQFTSAQIADASAHFDVLIQQANLTYQMGGIQKPY